MKIANQIEEMLKLQDKANTAVHNNWVTQGYNYALAGMVEGVECIDHTAWKWWKNGSTNNAQAFMEVVDITHFALSEAIKYNVDINVLNSAVEDSITCSYPVDKNHLEYFISLLVRELATISVFNLHSSISIPKLVLTDNPIFSIIDIFRNIILVAKQLGYDWDDIYKSYIGKNALNNLRQAYGYKTGNYIKDWSLPASESEAPASYPEDNNFLEAVLVSNTNLSYDNIYNILETHYQLVKKAHEVKN